MVGAESALYWVDIGEPRLLRFDLGSGVVSARRLPARAGCVIERDAGGLLLALQDGFATYDWETVCLARILDPEPQLPAID